jgi:hypothetical protein
VWPGLAAVTLAARFLLGDRALRDRAPAPLAALGITRGAVILNVVSLPSLPPVAQLAPTTVVGPGEWVLPRHCARRLRK